MADYLKKPLAGQTNDLAMARAADAISLTGKSLPCSVTEVVSSGVVVVQFEVSAPPFTLPKVKVPIFGSSYLRFPIQVGDKGVVFSADARLGGISGLGAGVASLDQPANLSALMFAWAGSTTWEEPDDPQAVCIVAPNGLLARNDADDARLTVNADGFAQEGKAGFFGTAPVDQPTISGALSAVTDGAAKAVLTSMIQALADLGLAIDGTT